MGVSSAFHVNFMYVLRDYKSNNYSSVFASYRNTLRREKKVGLSRDVKNKVVIITGASSGIGESTAILFAQHGSSVVLCGRDAARLASAVQKCKETGGQEEDRYLSLQGDLTDSAFRRQLIQETVKKFGRLDVLVSNAGIILEDIGVSNATETAFDQIMDVNVKATFFLILEAVPHLEKSKGCVIVNSSMGSTLAIPKFCIYTMSKAAVDHMTRTLALDLGPKGIRVNAINSTVVVPTNLFRHFSDQEQISQFYLDVGRHHPLHGRVSTCEEQASVILFLASSGASFITGECIKVDGGMTLNGAV